jgi:hypothetical protein
MALDLMRDIQEALSLEIETELGSTYKPLAYIENVEKNSFRTSNNRYGVRALLSNQVPGVTKNVTFIQRYQVVLTKGYVESNLDDDKQVQASFDLRELVLDIYKRVVNNRAGLPGTVLNIFNLTIEEPAYLQDDKVVIIRAEFDVTYRFSLI